ncbi:MAG TPA: hypothetical protein PLU65_11575, partial [Dokdonella sp.]|nr:hypothetical protein [Dokdonella sp.]
RAVRREIQRKDVPAGQQQSERQPRTQPQTRSQLSSTEMKSQNSHLTRPEATLDGVMLVRSLARTRLPWVIGCRKARTLPDRAQHRCQHSGRLTNAGRRTG